MTGIAIGSGDTGAKPGGIRSHLTDGRIAAFALFAVIAMQFPLIWQRSINWDEFYHYAQVHEFANGLLTQPLQSLRARMFVWVIDLPGSGIDHLIVTRFAMFAFELLAAVSIAGIAARFTDRVTGLIAAAAYVGGGFVFQHGFSFRADPMLAGLLTASLWLMLCTRMRAGTVILCGSMLALATMVSIKAVLFGPAFVGVAWLRWQESGRSVNWLIRLAALAIATLVAFACIYLWHASGVKGDNADAAAGLVNVSANKMFGIGNVPYLVYVSKQAMLAPLLAICILLFPGALIRARLSAHERVALVGLFLPLLTLLFYHNTAPYYYAFILPPVVAATSVAFGEFRRKFGTAIVAGLIILTTFLLWVKESSEPLQNQRTLVAAADRMFPGKTAYLDCCGFLGRFDKANVFMTPWGIELYKSGYYPSIKRKMAEQPVPLVMANAPMFSQLFETRDEVVDFLPEDAAAIRASYIHFWGPYWIAGKKFADGAPEAEFELLVPGPYTLRGTELILDGKRYRTGDVVQLQRATYRAFAPRGEAILVWGDKTEAPSQPAPSGPVWTAF
jgi:hypothetical protein